MTSRDFCYWLQGFYEIGMTKGPSTGLTPEQSDIVRRHLALVFKHEIDPSVDKGRVDVAKALQEIHDGPTATDKFPGPVYRC